MSEQTTPDTARTERAQRAAAARRVAIVAARRVEIGRKRAAVRAQLATSLRHRQEISFALVRLRRGLLEFRSEVRGRLRQIASDAIRRSSEPQP